MKVLVSICLLICLVFSSVPVSFAAGTGEDAPVKSNYVVNRGLFGVMYKGLTFVAKGFEYVMFGKYGLAGLSDYFRFDKLVENREYEY